MAETNRQGNQSPELRLSTFSALRGSFVREISMLHGSVMSTSPLEQLVRTMSLEELSQRSGRDVEDIVAYALAGKVQTSSGKSKTTNGINKVETKAESPKSKGARRPSTSSKNVDTRTAAGREAYDQAVLESIQSAKKPIGATDIRRKVGGTPLQVRTAAKRLEEGGYITSKGQARATRYSKA